MGAGGATRQEAAMSIRSRLAALAALTSRPGLAEAALVLAVAAIAAIMAILFLSGNMATLLESTAPYAPGA